MPLRSAASVALAVVVVAIPACTLTTSLSGLAGPADDAAAMPGDAVAIGDAEAADRGALPDGSPPLPYCQTVMPAPTFCDDFERSSPQGPWSSIGAAGGGVVTSEASTRGAGRELRTVIPFASGGGIEAATLERGFDEADEATLSYALRIDAPPAQGAQQLMALIAAYPGKPDFFHVYLFVHPDRVSLVEQSFPGGSSAGGAVKEHPLDPPIRFGVWQRIELTETLSTPHLRLRVDGKVAYDSAADSFFRRGAVSVSAGIHYTGPPSGPLSVRVDDLFLTLR